MKQEYFKDCYKILGLSEKKVITDEMVSNAYNSLMEQLSNFKGKAKTQEDIEYIAKLEIAIKDSYKILQTEEKRNKYNEFLLRVEKEEKKKQAKLETTKTEPKMSFEEYEQRRKKLEESRNKMQERLQESIKKMPSKKISEDGLRYTPIYRGQMNSTPKNNREEDDAR